MNPKLLLKRGGLLAAANWPLVVIQFVAQTTFQMLLAVPIVGAAVLVAVLLGGDLTNLLQGSMREIFATITDALTAQPLALSAFITAFGIALFGGSALTFLVKGGIIDVMRLANAKTDDIERQPLTLTILADAGMYSIPRFVNGCSRMFRPYLRLGLALMVAYGLTGVLYLAFIVYGYRTAGDGAMFFLWTVVAAVATLGLFFWITAINVLYLLMQIAMASGHDTLLDAARETARFIRAELRELGGIFIIVFGVVVVTWLASALAWSGVGLIAFVPLVGLAVFPLQLAAIIARGLMFEVIGLAAMGAYVTLYARYAEAQALAQPQTLQENATFHPAH
ncbi:MAG: hypothetical protein U0Q11_19305 [Vicinamibacterales bacterium]